jgi:hypothetical protein
MASSLNGYSASSEKYRGAVVEVILILESLIPAASDRSMHCFQDLQLPPAFALPIDEAISRAIELAYDRDFSHIPYVIVRHYHQ